ncbi:MAG: AAA family ATPase [Candidatus Caldarchaeum sp.]
MPIFQDRSKLSPSYIPDRMLHRDNEKQLLTQLLEAGVFRTSDTFVAKARVVGGVGAGKTTLCIKVGQMLERKHRKLKHVYINLRRFSASKVSIYRYLVKASAVEAYSASLSSEELLENLLQHQKNTGERLIITFDDADHHVQLCKGRETIIYDFTRLHEVSDIRPINVVGVVFVFRDEHLLNLLDKAEQSSLGAHTVRLQPYTTEQILEILFDRVVQAFRKGAVSDQIIEYIAETVSKPPYNGDVRLGFDVLLYAGNIAESRGQDYVRLDDVRHAFSEAFQTMGAAAVLELSTSGKKVLLALARTLMQKNEAAAELTEVKKMFQVVCEELGLPFLGFETGLKQLQTVGMVQLLEGRLVELRFADAERLAAALTNLLKKGEGL